MSQGSDETNKSTFVWEDPATERTLVKDLVKEFKKEVSWTIQSSHGQTADTL
jgi:hypothetical protein